jgi:Transposase DDE domain group 1
MTKITKIERTGDKISGRGGITLFLRYVQQTGFFGIALGVLSFVCISRKGLSLKQFITQMLAYFIDGTDMSMSGFDRKKEDAGYAAVLENTKAEMASSHQMKRFFSKLGEVKNDVYREILHRLFIWRLKLEKPKVIILDIDTMVMNNDDSKKKEGCEPTYKKKKGFQPLHISWGAYLIDVLFRNGKAHSNHGTDYMDTVRDIVALIRKRYAAGVPIILLADSGFFDQKAFDYFEQVLKILYVVTGKMYPKTKEYVKGVDAKQYKTYEQNGGLWRYFEFGNMLDSWKSFRRCIFTSLETEESGQLVLEFAKTDSIFYTNMGMDEQLREQLIEAGGEKYLKAQGIISLAHRRGANELVHRSIKELATKEQLPFKRMGMNRAYYYLLVITHFLFEAYKRDVTGEVLPITSYPNTFRRQLIDFAVKIVSHSGRVIMKVATAVYKKLNIEKIWERCMSPPKIASW